MTIEELRQKKKQLAKDLLEVYLKFKDETGIAPMVGLIITSTELDRRGANIHTSYKFDIKIEV